MTPVNPKKLLKSKWTAVNPVRKEKHFLVIEVDYDEDGRVIHCLMEAVMTGRSFSIPWRELKNEREWLAGWK